MKLILFIFSSIILGGGIAYFYHLPREDKKIIWNKTNIITASIIITTLITLFSLAAFGSNISFKLF